MLKFVFLKRAAVTSLKIAKGLVNVAEMFSVKYKNVLNWWAWLAQLERSLLSYHKVPSSILGSAEI